jgi:hypothetical protein
MEALVLAIRLEDVEALDIASKCAIAGHTDQPETHSTLLTSDPISNIVSEGVQSTEPTPRPVAPLTSS